MKKYLFWFANEHVDFRLNEIKSIVRLFGLDFRIEDRQENKPWWVVSLSNDEDVKKVANRSVSLRYAIELWGHDSSSELLHKKLRELPPDFLQPYSSPDHSYKIKVETFSNSQTQDEKVRKIESFHYLPLQGPVKLKKPDLVLMYIEFYGINPCPPPIQPEMVFFGNLIAEGQRDIINTFSLKKRKFIGNTSMDPQLALIMANQALVKPGDIVLDPFVGTGSLLVAAAHFGGYVLGTDIDYLMIHGKTRPSRKQDRGKKRCEESVLNNMKQYGLESRYLDIVVADSSLPTWTDNLLLDSIITDPPYGMREAVERVGAHKENITIAEEHLANHIPSKVPYGLTELLDDLLQFAARHLRLGSRLVTWIPIIRNEYQESDLPNHPCLELVGNSEQVLSTASSRRLITYEKISQPPDTPINSEPTGESESQSFRERYYLKAEEIRRGRKMKAYQNQQYLLKKFSVNSENLP